MSKSTELLPCPFCGGDPVMHTIDEHGPNFGAQFIECSSCQCSTYLMFPLMDSVDRQLAEKWNSRIDAHLASQPEAAQEPVLWQSRVRVGGKWSRWSQFKPPNGIVPEVGIVNCGDAQVESRALYARPAAQEEMSYTIDWAKNGDHTCVAIYKKYLNGNIELLGTEFDPAAPQPKGGERE